MNASRMRRFSSRCSSKQEYYFPSLHTAYHVSVERVAIDVRGLVHLFLFFDHLRVYMSGPHQLGDHHGSVLPRVYISCILRPCARGNVEAVRDEFARNKVRKISSSKLCLWYKEEQIFQLSFVFWNLILFHLNWGSLPVLICAALPLWCNTSFQWNICSLHWSHVSTQC